MIDHDKNVGQVLKALDDLGIAGDTFVLYSTDNGPHMNSAQSVVGGFLMTFKEYPQRQKAASFNMDEVFRKLRESGGSK